MSSGFAAGVRGAFLALATAALLAGSGGRLMAQTPQQVQSVTQEVIRRLDLQTNLPREPEPRPVTLRLPAEVLWVVVVIALGVLLYAFRDLLPGLARLRQGGAWSDAAAMPDGSDGRSPTAVMGAADDLAAQGRFVEAMHVLLLQGLSDIRERLAEQFADSLTSREILRRAQLSAEGRTSLQDIIHRVEWTYFGEHPAALVDYQACRASFDALARALHGSAAA